MNNGRILMSIVGIKGFWIVFGNFCNEFMIIFGKIYMKSFCKCLCLVFGLLWGIFVVI